MKPNKNWLKQDCDAILRQKLQPVLFPLNQNDNIFLDKMVQYIDASYNDKAEELDITSGIAIAANQVGWDKQVIYIHFNHGDNEYKYLLANPKIVSYSQGMCYLDGGEGCLSVQEKHQGVVPRRAKIKVSAYDMINKKNVEINAEDLLAINLQHEIDHLNGILYYDRIDKNDPFFIQNDWIKI